MAVGGSLVSELPLHGLPAEEIEEATGRFDEEVSTLPNQQPSLVIVSSDADYAIPVVIAQTSTGPEGKCTASAEGAEIVSSLPAVLHNGDSQETLQSVIAPTSKTGAPPDRHKYSEKTESGAGRGHSRVQGVIALESAAAIPDLEDRLEEGQSLLVDFAAVDLTTRHALLLKCTKALMTFGAPSHRVEADLAFGAKVLKVEAQFIQNPNCVGECWQYLCNMDHCLPFRFLVINFGTSGSHTGDSIFIKHENGGLDLGNVGPLIFSTHAVLLIAVSSLPVSTRSGSRSKVAPLLSRRV